jgi:hypothetical protein
VVEPQRWGDPTERWAAVGRSWSGVLVGAGLARVLPMHPVADPGRDASAGTRSRGNRDSLRTSGSPLATRGGDAMKSTPQLHDLKAG